MSDAQALIDVRGDETFMADKAALENALAHAERFATDKPLSGREEAGEASDAIKALKGAIKDAKENKLGITEEWRASTNHVNEQYRELLSKPEAAEEAIKAKGLAWKREEQERAAAAQAAAGAQQKRDREEAERVAREAAELLEEEPENPEAVEFAIEARQEALAAAAAPAPIVPDAPERARGDNSLLTSYTVYRFEVVDPALVPPKYRTKVDEPAVKADVDAEWQAAKAEERDFNLKIPGIRIYPKEIGVSR